MQELPGDHWLKDPKYDQALSALAAMDSRAVLVSDGNEAYVAFQKGDNIEGSMYSAKTGVGILQEITAIPKISSKMGKLKGLGSVKGQAALTVAVGAIEAGINLHKASETNDQILKQSYYEAASANAIDTGISCIPTYGQVIQESWSKAVTIFSLVAPNELAESVCSSPGTAITFFVQYFFTTTIPSDVAEKAYKYAAGKEVDWVNYLNEVENQPAVFIQPE